MELEYVYIVTRGHLFRICLDKLSGKTPPPVEHVIDFRKEKMPIGMGVFSFNSKIYLFGGEYIREDKTLDCTNRAHVLDRSRGDDGISSDIYELDPEEQVSSFSRDIPSMYGAKPKPQIVTVDGKIYILGTEPHCTLDKIFHPAFECYDPSDRKWSKLQEPPHYNDKDDTDCFISGADGPHSYFAFGRKIWLNNHLGLSSFDVDAKVWNSFSYMDLDHNLAILAKTISFACGDKGVVVAYTYDGLMAYFYGDDGGFKLEEKLSNIGDVDFDPRIPGTGFVHFLGDGRFCIVLYGDMVHGKYWAVRVTTFTVDVLGISEIKATILNSHEYEFSLRVPDSENQDIDNIFIAKGGERELEDALIEDAFNRWFTFPVSSPLPETHFQHVAAAIEDKIYMLGGGQGVIDLNYLHALDMSRRTWFKVNFRGSGRIAPCARPSLIQWGVDKLLLIIGYANSTHPFEVILFNLKSSTWSILNICRTPPISREGHSVTLVEDKRLIVFGGIDVNGSLLNDIHILDLMTMVWVEKDRSELMPCPRMDHAAAIYEAQVMGLHLFIFGGRSDTACFNDLHILNLETMRWSRPSQKGELPSPRTGHAGSLIGIDWYLIGGEDENGNGVPDTIVLHMETMVWSTVTSVQGNVPFCSKDLSLVTALCHGQSILVSFGEFGNSGHCTSKVNVLRRRCIPNVIEPVVLF